jgi:hypothetical protein
MTCRSKVGVRVFLGCLAILTVLLVVGGAVGPASSAFRGDAIAEIPPGEAAVIPVNGKQECEKLDCKKCNGLCTAYCEVENKACQDSGQRGCPGKYRSCVNGCKYSLCRQCMPVQYLEGDKKYYVGTTRLCHTPPYTKP